MNIVCTPLHILKGFTPPLEFVIKDLKVWRIPGGVGGTDLGQVGWPGQVLHCMWVLTVSKGYIKVCSAMPAMEPATQWVKKEPLPSHSSQSRSSSVSSEGWGVAWSDMGGGGWVGGRWYGGDGAESYEVRRWVLKDSGGLGS